MTATFKAPSGAEIAINMAPWRDAKHLKNALEKETAALGSLPEGVQDMASIISMLKIDSSPDFDAALWPCLARCTRNNEKITEETFNDIEARRDYYEIVLACIKENLAPLVESLFSKFAELGVKRATQSGDQKPESTTPTSSPQ